MRRHFSLLFVSLVAVKPAAIGSEPPASCVDPDTGHRVVGLTNGDPTQVARAPDGQWIYLFRAEPIPNRGVQDNVLIQPGVFRSECLVNMSKHNYRLEPNVSFTPDEKWVVFRSNFIYQNVAIAEARRRGKLRAGSFAHLQKRLANSQAELEIQDFGDAEKLLSNGEYLRSSAQRLIKRGVIPVAGEWEGWPGAVRDCGCRGGARSYYARQEAQS